MSKYLITVLMPVYNSEKYISEAIKSILKQTLTELEFLIIDDGSTDSSVEIIRSFNDRRIRLVQNEFNLGISETLNKGIELCDTELIARMDSDDKSYPERLQKQYDYLQSDEDCALVSTTARVISKDGQPIRIDKYPVQFYYYNLNFICWIYHPTVMFKRSAVNNVGKYDVPYSEDFNLWWKISRKFKIYHLQDVLLDYRESEESLSNVVKRNEYEIAQHKQVIRNVQYYTGSKFILTYEDVECLRFNFQPLLLKNNIRKIAAFFKKLKFITDCIIKNDNVNLNKGCVLEAYKYKEAYTSAFFVNRLSPFNAICLFIKLRQFKKCIKYIFKML